MDGAVPLAAVGALAVDHHRRCGDKAPNSVPPCDHSLEQGGGTAGVVVHGSPDVDHRLTVSHHAAEVEDAIDVTERAFNGVEIAQVPDHQLCVAIKMLGRAVLVRERVEIVEHPHAVAVRQQHVDQVRADETGAAGDEGGAHQTV
jgi:hypothetical protein